MRRQVARALKALICALLVFGLMPGADALVASAARLVHADVAATEDCADCADCADHGCTPLAHCKCCGSASASALAPRAPFPERFAPANRQERHLSVSERGPPNAGVKPSLRPPIA